MSLSFRLWMWTLAALFFASSYVIRVAPAEMVPFLMTDFSVGSSAMTSMLSAFLLSYIALQIPAGILLDRYPPHQILWLATACMLLAALIFYLANSFTLLVVSRFILGMGSAFAFAGSVKMATLWFDGAYLGRFTSLTQVAGMLGAASQGLIDDGIAWLSWRPFVGMFTLWCALLLLLMLLFWRDHPDARKREHTRSNDLARVWNDFKEIMCNAQTWYVALYCGFLFAPTLVFGENLGVAYFAAVRPEWTSHQASLVVSMVFLGFALGGLFQGVVSDLLARRRLPLFFSALGSLLSFTWLLYVDADWRISAILAFIYGLFNSGLVVGYTLSGEINLRRISGSSIAFANMMSVLVGMVVLHLSGFFLDTLKEMGMSVLHAYEVVFGVLPLLLFIAIILVVLIHETYAKAWDET